MAVMQKEKIFSRKWPISYALQRILGEGFKSLSKKLE
jgi:hypothetical protein